MSSLVLLTLAFVLTIDTFAVSVALGLSCRGVRWRSLCRVPFTFAVVQALMPLAGWGAGFGLKKLVEEIDHWVAFALLAVIGATMIRDSIRAPKAVDPEEPDLSRRRVLSLAVATSIDAFAVGLTMPLLDVSVFAFPLTVGLATFVVSTVGLCAGHRVGEFVERRVELLGGTILLGIGTKILVSHMT